MTEKGRSVRLRVSPQVARIVNKEAPREVQLLAARGAIPLQGQDLLTALFFLFHGGDPELRQAVIATLTGLPPGILVPAVGNPDLHPHLLDFVARLRPKETVVMEPLLANPATPVATLVRLAAVAEGPLLSLIACNDQRLAQIPELAAALIANPHADRGLKFRLGWTEPVPTAPAETTEEDPTAAVPVDEAGDGPQGGEEDETEEPAEVEEVEEVEEINQSKYQQSLQMEVADKIKIALTGDKEWRNIFIKDANKLVSSAVLKNPRITEPEVLAIAKNRTSNEELIRLITINREWVKVYEIQKALVLHPRTPLPKALRYMNVLTPKDLKNLAKSRNVAQVVANNARRMVAAKDKKK